MEYVSITFTLKRNHAQGIVVHMISPSGRIAVTHPLLLNQAIILITNGTIFLASTRAFLGENPNGKWTIMFHRDGLIENDYINFKNFTIVGLKVDNFLIVHVEKQMI